VAPNLVLAAGTLGSFSVFAQGTPLLGQLHDDLGALLDATLTTLGNDPQITPLLIDQVQRRLAPPLGAAGQRPVRLVALWADPVSLDLVDPAGDLNYNLSSGQLSNTIPDSYVSVVGNVEVVVLAVPADGSTLGLTLNVANVPATARGGVVLLGENTDQTLALTDALQQGVTSFNFGF
jgi:hypothetical protein